MFLILSDWLQQLTLKKSKKTTMAWQIMLLQKLIV
nr:MAG TPA: hypothetical protein [Bacteriophage sp.]